MHVLLCITTECLIGFALVLEDVSSIPAIICYSRNVSVNLFWLQRGILVSIYMIQCSLQRLVTFILAFAINLSDIVLSLNFMH